MQTHILERDTQRAKIKVEVPAGEVSTTFQQVVTGIARQLRVPGFRPGKAPRGVVENRVGKDAIAQEVRDALVQTYFPRAVTQLELNPVGQHLHAHEPVDGQDYSFEAELELYPDFTLPDLSQIVFDTEQTPVTDELVQASVETLRRQHVTLIPVERPAEAGDYLLVETVASVGSESSIPVDLENVAPELAEQFVGRSIGDEIELTLADESSDEEALSDADEYRDEAVEAITEPATDSPTDADTPTGPSTLDTVLLDADDEKQEPQRAAADAESAVTSVEPSTLRVIIKDIKEKELPEADDEFAKTLGADSWTEVQAQLRQDLELRHAQEALAARQDEFVEKLMLETPMAVPPSLKTRRKSSLLQNLSDDLAARKLTMQAYLADLDAEAGKREAFERELDEAAETAVKRDLVLDKLLQGRQTVLSDAELEAALNYMASRQNSTVGALRQELGESGIANYRFLLTRDKAVRETVTELIQAQDVQNQGTDEGNPVQSGE